MHRSQLRRNRLRCLVVLSARSEQVQGPRELPPRRKANPLGRVRVKALATAIVSFTVCLSLLVTAAARADVRYAGHVWLTHTSCCGFNQVVFKTFGRSEVPYRVCVRRPTGERRCKSGRTEASGQPSRKSFVSNAVGTYRVTWKVEGQVVDSSKWVNVAEGV